MPKAKRFGGLNLASALAIGGTVLGGIGKLRQGSQAKAVGRYNQEAAEREAEGLEIQAGQEIAAASHNAIRLKKRQDEILAQGRAAAAAGGGSTSDLTVAAIRDETVATSALDQLNLAVSAQERAQQIRHGADVKRSEGALAAYQGNQAFKAGLLGAGGTLLKAGSQAWDAFG